MAAASRPDVLIVSLAATAGLRAADDELATMLRDAGATVELARATPQPDVRTLMYTDLRWALAARRAAAPRLAAGAPAGVRPRAVIYSTTTAALLWHVPGAIRFDAPSLANRPGRHGLWQRPLERRRLKQAPLLLPLSEGGLEEAGLAGGPAARERALVLPLPVAASGPPVPPQERDIAAITYGGNPAKKGLGRVLSAWRAARSVGAGSAGPGSDSAVPGPDSAGELVVAGASPEELRSAGIDLAGEPGVRSVGRLDRGEYRALLRRSRVFLAAPRREDYGQAQLEALADGCLLVTAPAPGPYAALPIARALDGRLVGEDLGGALAVGLAVGVDAAREYAARAAEMLEPWAPAAIERRMAGELLPRLLG